MCTVCKFVSTVPKSFAQYEQYFIIEAKTLKSYNPFSFLVAYQQHTQFLQRSKLCTAWKIRGMCYKQKLHHLDKNNRYITKSSLQI